MDRTRRRELFWLLLIAGCVGLFAVRHERRAEAYDRFGMNELVRETQTERVAPRPAARVHANDTIETVSIAPRAALPITRPGPAASAASYYVPLGSYQSFDLANRRYIDVARHDPALENNNKIRIETVDIAGQGQFHRVRLGNFASRVEAQNACQHAGIGASLCLVVASR
ncbi:MAG: SPOR domain-containing protein [Parvibaculum sp.]